MVACVGWEGRSARVVTAPANRRRRAARAPADVRGVLVSVASAAVFTASFLPWYAISSVGTRPTDIGGQVFSIVSATFGGWRLAIPFVAAMTVACGILEALLRADTPGAMLSFITVRVLVLVQIGLVVATLLIRTPTGVPGALHVVASARWPAWGSLGCAVVALGGSFATAPGKT